MGFRKNISKLLIKNRMIVQGIATLISNGHIANFFTGSLYDGNGKAVCVPGLNCYSCPGASASCPIGSFQAVGGSYKYNFSYYVLGLTLLLGALMGRLVCGFLCPFGWFQELIHKIPTKKFSTKKLKFLRYFKYVMLFGVVWILGSYVTGASGIGTPYFCKYVCPQGILEGAIPLAVADESIRDVLGVLFTWKAVILSAVVTGSVFFYRPFCKWVCPLGAFYALLNKFSLYQYGCDEDKCISCGKCARVCGMDVDMSKNQDSPECIRCGECKKACPTGAIYTSFSGREK